MHICNSIGIVFVLLDLVSVSSRGSINSIDELIRRLSEKPTMPPKQQAIIDKMLRDFHGVTTPPDPVPTVPDHTVPEYDPHAPWAKHGTFYNVFHSHIYSLIQRFNISSCAVCLPHPVATQFGFLPRPRPLSLQELKELSMNKTLFNLTMTWPEGVTPAPRIISPQPMADPPICFQRKGTYPVGDTPLSKCQTVMTNDHVHLVLESSTPSPVQALSNLKVVNVIPDPKSRLDQYELQYYDQDGFPAYGKYRLQNSKDGLSSGYVDNYVYPYLGYYHPWLRNIEPGTEVLTTNPKDFKIWPDGLLALVGHYFVCGTLAYVRLPADWSGNCYIATLDLPWKLVPYETLLGTPSSRQRRATDDSSVDIRAARKLLEDTTMLTQQEVSTFAGTVWLSTFGAIRPTQRYGEQLLRIYALIEVTAQDLTDALTIMQGTVDKLTAYSAQNRMALDYLLAKDGGVCGVVRDHCCTIVDSQSKVVTGILEQVRKETHFSKDNIEGTSDSVWPWFDNIWSGLSGPVKAILTGLFGFLVALLLLGIGLVCFMKCCTTYLPKATHTIAVLKLRSVPSTGDLLREMPFYEDCGSGQNQREDCGRGLPQLGPKCKLDVINEVDESTADKQIYTPMIYPGYADLDMSDSDSDIGTDSRSGSIISIGIKPKSATHETIHDTKV